MNKMIQVRVCRRAIHLGAEGKVYKFDDLVELTPLEAADAIDSGTCALVDGNDFAALAEARARHTHRLLVEARRAPAQPDDPHWRR